MMEKQLVLSGGALSTLLRPTRCFPAKAGDEAIEVMRVNIAGEAGRARNDLRPSAGTRRGEGGVPGAFRNCGRIMLGARTSVDDPGTSWLRRRTEFCAKDTGTASCRSRPDRPDHRYCPN
jgi:hypothetical protein